MSHTRVSPHPEIPDIGESSPALAAYCHAVAEALRDRDAALEAKQEATDEAATALMSTLTQAVATLADLHTDEGTIADLTATVDASTTAVAVLLPQVTPSRAVPLWRELWRDRDTQLSLLLALPQGAREQLTAADVMALASHVGRGHKIGTLQQFLLEGGTGVPAVDCALFRQLAEDHPSRLLAVLEGGGPVATVLGPTDVAPLLRAKATDVRTRALMAMSTLGLAREGEGAPAAAPDVLLATAPRPSAPTR
jgi:hypothetical protein